MMSLSGALVVYFICIARLFGLCLNEMFVSLDLSFIFFLSLSLSSLGLISSENKVSHPKCALADFLCVHQV